jgi:hypothetical protein
MGEKPHGQRGQATVELIGLVFALLLVALLVIQAITVAQTASIAQEAARHGARALSLGQDWNAAVERAVPDRLDLQETVAGVDDGTAHVRVAVSAPMSLAGLKFVDVTLTRTAAFPVGD